MKVEQPVSSNVWTRTVLNKGPDVTALFWIVTMMSVTVGGTGADYLSGSLGLGLPISTGIVCVLLIPALIAQFSSDRHVPWTYWLALTLMSIGGTLFADSLADLLGAGVGVPTAVFGVGLAASLLGWRRKEKTLSFHAIVTRRGEAFHWLTILLVFAFGTSAGDLLGQRLDGGDIHGAKLLGAVVCLSILAHYGYNLNAVFAFWLTYIVTGAAGVLMAGVLTQSPEQGGAGHSMSGTSAVLLIAIVVCVGFFTVRQQAETRVPAAA